MSGTMKKIDTNLLSKATLVLSYLETNSSSHPSPFSAIAELSDNAYDANAKNFYIDFETIGNEEVLKFSDDGKGMTPKEMHETFAFGHSRKATKTKLIGRFGNGLKSGGFHLGRELFIVTKHKKTFTALLISHKFHEENGLKEAIFVACPSFDQNGDVLPDVDPARFETEMEIINKYAPLGGKSLKDWFSEIQGPSGTIIIISGLRRDMFGKLYFNTSVPNDLTQGDDDKEPWEYSLRNYFKILYLEPKVKIVLRGEEVKPIKASGGWMFRRRTTFRGSDFKDGAKRQERELTESLESAQRELALEQSKIGSMNRCDMSIDRESRIARNRAIQQISVKQEYVEERTNAVAEYKKFKKMENLFKVNLGVNVMDRQSYGVNFYINNRLIIPNHRKKMPFYKNNANSIGVSMYVDLDYEVFLPNHNKQRFESDKDFNVLVRKCNEQLVLYEKYLMGEGIPNHLKNVWGVTSTDDMNLNCLWDEFWKRMGYKNPRYTKCEQSRPLTVEQERVIGADAAFWAVCDVCRKWRFFPFQYNKPRFMCSDIPYNTSGCAAIASVENFEGLKAPTRKPSPNSSPLSSLSSSDCVVVLEVTAEKSARNQEEQPEQLFYDRSRDRYKDEPLDEDIEMRDRRQISQTPSVCNLKSKEIKPADKERIEVDLSESSESSSSGVKLRQRRPETSRSNPTLAVSIGSTERKKSRTTVKQSKTRRPRENLESEDEEEDVPVKRRRGREAKVAQRTTMNREKWLEEKLNEFLVATGQQALPKNGQREINPKEIIERRQKNAVAVLQAQNKTLKGRVERVGKSLRSLLNYAEKLPGFGLKIPEYEATEQFVGFLEKNLPKAK